MRSSLSCCSLHVSRTISIKEDRSAMITLLEAGMGIWAKDYLKEVSQECK